MLKLDTEKVNRPIEIMDRGEVIKLSKLPWVSQVTLVKKNNFNLRLYIGFRILNTVAEKCAILSIHTNDSLNLSINQSDFLLQTNNGASASRIGDIGQIGDKIYAAKRA